MRNNYVADRGDYFKYGLLITLCQTGLNLGIIWYLFPDEEPKFQSHGSDTSYLNDLSYQKCSLTLFNTLKEIAEAQSEPKDIALIRKTGLFPSNTVFYEEPISLRQHSHFLKKRLHRRQWFEAALEATQACDMVFLDPDTGLETKSKHTHEDNEGPKYVSYDEVQQLIQREQTVVIYQHTLREPVEATIAKTRANIQSYLNFQAEIPVYYFKAGSSRMFFILPARRHQASIASILKTYDASPWEAFSHRY